LIPEIYRVDSCVVLVTVAIQAYNVAVRSENCLLSVNCTSRKMVEPLR